MIIDLFLARLTGLKQKPDSRQRFCKGVSQYRSEVVYTYRYPEGKKLLKNLFTVLRLRLPTGKESRWELVSEDDQPFKSLWSDITLPVSYSWLAVHLPVGDSYTSPDLGWIPAGLANAPTTGSEIALIIYPVWVAISTATWQGVTTSLIRVAVDRHKQKASHKLLSCTQLSRKNLEGSFNRPLKKTVMS